METCQCEDHGHEVIKDTAKYIAKVDIINNIDTQLNQFIAEHEELTKRSDEYLNVVENIRIKLFGIKGAVDALNSLKDTFNNFIESNPNIGFIPSESSMIEDNEHSNN